VSKANYPKALPVDGFKKLLRTLRGIVERELGKELDKTKLRFLCAEVRLSVVNYGALQFAANYASTSALPELQDLLSPITPRVIEILEADGNESDANEGEIAIRLGSYGNGYSDIEYGIELRNAIIAGLRRILAVPSPKRSRGRPRNRDLHELVYSLANAWEKLTGDQFTQAWDCGVPYSPGAGFVHAVVEFVDPENLKSVPKMTERFVEERREAERSATEQLGVDTNLTSAN